jgi:VanZ family protein
MIASILTYLERHTYILYAALALLTLVTLALTLLPQEKLVDARIFRYDKLGHMLMFGSWTFLLGMILLVSNRKPLPLFAIFLAGSLFGITIEILQEVLPVDRHMNPYDALADIIGCLIAVGFLKVITTYSTYGKKQMEQ